MIAPTNVVVNERFGFKILVVVQHAHAQVHNLRAVVMSPSMVLAVRTTGSPPIVNVMPSVVVRLYGLDPLEAFHRVLVILDFPVVGRARQVLRLERPPPAPPELRVFLGKGLVGFWFPAWPFLDLPFEH